MNYHVTHLRVLIGSESSRAIMNFNDQVDVQQDIIGEDITMLPVLDVI